MRLGLQNASAQMGEETFLKDLILTMKVETWHLKWKKKERKISEKHLSGMKHQNDLL